MGDEYEDEARGDRSAGTSSIDKIADKLVERREKFGYFIVTASVGVIVFTLQNLNAEKGLLAEGWMTAIVVGAILLLLAAGASLYLIWERHNHNWHYLSIRYTGRVLPNEEELVQVRSRLDRMQTATTVMMLTFVLGMASLVLAYVSAVA